MHFVNISTRYRIAANYKDTKGIKLTQMLKEIETGAYSLTMFKWSTSYQDRHLLLSFYVVHADENVFCWNQ